MPLTLAALSWPIVDFKQFVYRAADPTAIDVVLGSLTILLVLEATRRSVGWILPATALGFLAYGWAGPAFDRIGLPLIAHRGYELDRLVGTLYMTLEGIFGVPLDVAATYIILFTIYGAVLEQSGAGRFFIDWSMAAMGRSRLGRRAGADGHARRVSPRHGVGQRRGDDGDAGIGGVAAVAARRLSAGDGWRHPLGRRHRRAASRRRRSARRRSSSPSSCKISYLQVLVMASIPTLLYYLSILLMIEADSRRLGTRGAGSDVGAGIGALPPLRLPLHLARRDRRASWSRACRRSAPSSGRPCSPSR